MTEGNGEFADCGLLSCGGEEAKHSSADISDDAGSGSPLPNLNGGSWLSARAQLKETELVVCPLARAKEGLSRVDLRRLQPVRHLHQKHMHNTHSKGMGCFGASDKVSCIATRGLEMIISSGVTSGVGEGTRSWVITA